MAENFREGQITKDQEGGADCPATKPTIAIPNEVRNLILRASEDGLPRAAQVSPAGSLCSGLSNGSTIIEMESGFQGGWNVNFARLDALRQNIPSSIDEDVVRDYNSMVLALQVASHDENLVNFRIPDTELKPRIASIQRGTRRFPGRTTYSKENYCDDDFFERQLQGLWGYIQKTRLPEDERKTELAQAATNHASAWALIHPEIVEISKTRFDARHFADAAEAAFKLINERVKTIVKGRTGIEFDGAPLMQKAFSSDNPVIALDDISTLNGKNVQIGYQQLFSGAMTGIRNPKAHSNVQIDAARSMHLIFLASLLMSKLDEAP